VQSCDRFVIRNEIRAHAEAVVHGQHHIHLRGGAGRSPLYRKARSHGGP
jgi:hypothetical protein